jgi:hypothetical protein
MADFQRATISIKATLTRRGIHSKTLIDILELLKSNPTIVNHIPDEQIIKLPCTIMSCLMKS